MHVLLGAMFITLLSGATPAPQMPDALGQAPDWAHCMNNPACQGSLLGLQYVAALQTQAILDLRGQLRNLESRIETLEDGEQHGQ